ncbi:MAG: hypothetical protein L6R40_006381 [Gallowayella cf. fulva]|nr:MAG: hypothetical protein L6R40_006381 [Xanthomendoza cf. fulva]
MFDFLTPSKPRIAHARSHSTPYPSFPPRHSDHDEPTSFHHHTVPKPPALSHPPPYSSPSQTNQPPRLTKNVQQTRPTLSTTKLSDWFIGESEPIAFAILPSPSKEGDNPVKAMTASQPEYLPAIQEKPPVSRTTPKPPTVSRFPLFGSKPSTPKASIPADIYDEWHHLHVKTALVPSGATEPYSPSAIKSLQQNAETLLSRLQGAYKQRSEALHDVLAEKEALAEEYEGAAMRSRHLKLQLDDMSTKLAEQDMAMMDLVDQLAQEKQARREAEDVRCSRNPNGRNSSHGSDKGDGQQTRKSSKSRTSTASEMSLESEESCAESLFSRRGATSPTMSMSSVSTMDSPESASVHQLSSTTDHFRRPIAHSVAAETPYQAAKPKSSDDAFSSVAAQNPPCANCSGLRDSEAWSLVKTLKLENKGLKTRLGQLETTVDDCLDMIQGLF